MLSAPDCRIFCHDKGGNHPFDEASNLDGRRGSAAMALVHPRPPGPEPAKPFALPADDRVGSDVHQGSAPASPQQGHPHPEQSVEGSQCGSLRFSLEGNELNAESGVLHRDGAMTAQEESHETKQGQDEDRHEPRFLVSPALKVKSLPADRLLASHKLRSMTEDRGIQKFSEATGKAEAAEQLRVEARQRPAEHQAATGHR